MFYVMSKELEEIYNYCEKNEVRVPLCKNSDGMLIMILSGSKQSKKEIGRIKCSMYNGNLRFYEVKKIVFKKTSKAKKTNKKLPNWALIGDEDDKQNPYMKDYANSKRPIEDTSTDKISQESSDEIPDSDKFKGLDF
jgi:hypothetical protein